MRVFTRQDFDYGLYSVFRGDDNLIKHKYENPDFFKLLRNFRPEDVKKLEMDANREEKGLNKIISGIYPMRAVGITGRIWVYRYFMHGRYHLVQF